MENKADNKMFDNIIEKLYIENPVFTKYGLRFDFIGMDYFYIIKAENGFYFTTGEYYLSCEVDEPADDEEFPDTLAEKGDNELLTEEELIKTILDIYE